MIILKLHIRLAEKRMMQKDLVELTGINKNTIASYVNDTYKFLGKDHLDKICEALDCSITDLIEYKKTEN